MYSGKKKWDFYMINLTLLYITPSLTVGGAEKFLALLSNALSNETRKEILVSLSDSNPLRPEINKEISFHSMPRRKKLDIRAIRRLRKLIKAEQPDVAICLSFFSYLFLRIACAGFVKSPKRIISYHSTIHLSMKEDYLHRLSAKLLNENDLIITVSRNQAKYTAERYHIPMNFFKTIYNGIDTNHWKPPLDNRNRNQIRAKYGLPENAKVVIMAASFRLEKNHTGALKALHILHNIYNLKAYLLLVGNGAMIDDMKKLATELEIQDHVKFAGMQYDVRPFYWASDLFTLCSYSETFSIAALEAMACGLPCVLTDIGGADEMIVQGLNGYLCKPDEQDIAVTWLKAMNDSFSEERIVEYVQRNFHKDKMVNEYKEILSGY